MRGWNLMTGVGLVEPLEQPPTEQTSATGPPCSVDAALQLHVLQFQATGPAQVERQEGHPVTFGRMALLTDVQGDPARPVSFGLTLSPLAQLH